MNFVSHFFLDRDLNDSLYVVGACTPDLLSIFDRSIKLKEHRLARLVQDSTLSPEQQSFYQGVLRHLEVDRLFHSSAFFHEETLKLAQRLREMYPPEQLKRSFFVAHIMIELLLDRVLIGQDEDLVREFYTHFRARPRRELVALSSWVAQRPISGYDDFLKRFIDQAYLYRYREPTHIIRVVKHILRRVHIFEYPYLDSPGFKKFMKAYEGELSTRYPAFLEEFTQVLSAPPPRIQSAS